MTPVPDLRLLLYLSLRVALAVEWQLRNRIDKTDGHLKAHPIPILPLTDASESSYS